MFIKNMMDFVLAVLTFNFTQKKQLSVSAAILESNVLESIVENTWVSSVYRRCVTLKLEMNLLVHRVMRSRI